MAHFAQLDQHYNVVSVVVVSNEDCLNLYGEEDEIVGKNYLNNIFGENTIWIQTSYNGKFRKNFAGIGFIYDSTRNAFISKKPYPSWILDEETCMWIAPLERPKNDNIEMTYDWNEEKMIWEGRLE